jgi:hypothetical protein
MKILVNVLSNIDPSSIMIVNFRWFRLWHMTQSKVAMWHINWIFKTDIYLYKYKYLGKPVHNHKYVNW